MNLNKEQLEAIAAGEGAWNVLATAGAGKSEVLVRRAKRLLNEGASPDDLLLVTFTREAANSIATRLGVKFTKDQRGGPRTFHSFCLNLIRKESRFLPYGLSANPFPEGPALYKLLLEAMKKNGLRRKNYEEAKAFISRCKRQRISPEQACEDPLTDHLFARTYSTYESMLREGGMLDFDSMMVEAVNMLEKYPDVRDRWQFKWVLVDEAQDTDDLQFRLLQLLWAAHGNIFVVGDYCQALYEFRGANPENLVQFVNWFPGAQTIILPENFRCHPPGEPIDVCVKGSGKFINGSTSPIIEQIPIEKLVDGMKVVSWRRRELNFKLRGRPVKVSQQPYNGRLIKFTTSFGKSTEVTPNHKMYFRWIDGMNGKGIVYLMWREGWGFRIGICSFSIKGRDGGYDFRLWHRIKAQSPDKTWILQITETEKDARTQEKILAAQYGILTMEFDSNAYWSPEETKAIFASIPHDGGYSCLAAHGRHFQHPFCARSDETVRVANGTRTGYIETAASNIIPNVMKMPVKDKKFGEVVADIKTRQYEGLVYSLDVPKEHNYVVNGIVVGNSSAEIVEYSKKNAPIDNELTRNIRTSNPRSGVPIEFRMYAGPAEEAEATLSAASVDPGYSAILARTNNQLGLFETLALQHNIKFHRLGKSGFWNQPEVNMLVNLAAFCMGTKASAKYSETLVDPYRRSIRASVPEIALQNIINFARLENLYSNEDYSDDENFAINNLYTVAGIAKRFRTLQEFLNHARKAAHASRKTKNAVTLATIHAAKGLEWDNVFVVGMERGKLPHEKGTLAEEKRIWYVARTRPRKRLRVSFAGTPSEFLAADLTPEIQRELRKHAETVEKIQKQQELFA